MRCTKPIRGYRAPGGQVKFDTREGYVGVLTQVSCGRCAGCRLRRSRDWALRCMHEASQHEQSSFLTLTYSDEHLPEDGSLDVREWQLFAKRVRKRVGPFRFFHCGEYGDRYGRPHYHACVFGLDFSGDRRLWKTSGGHRLYVSPTLDELWGRGHALIGDVTYDSAAYVARYCLKKRHGDGAEEHYGGRKPEYCTMSRRPGLGRGWYERFGNEVREWDEVIANGVPRRPPKFYDSLFEMTDPEGYDAVMERRRAKALEHHEPWERLKTIERVQAAKDRIFEREPDDS